MPWKEAPILVIDTETTGLYPPESRVIEIAAILLKKPLAQVPVATFEVLSWPGKEAFEDGKADEALAVNRIDPGELEREAKPEPQVAQDLQAWVGQHCIEPTQVTTFNVDFDSQFLIPKPWEITGRSLLWGPCIMIESMKIMGYRPSLGMAIEFFEVERKGNAHRAMSDTQVSVEIMQKIQSREARD